MPNHRPNDSKERAKDLLGPAEEMQSARQPFNSVWEQVADYCGVEFKGFTGEVTHPYEPDEGVVDSTAKHAAKVFSAGMQSGASSPSQRWFSLAFEDKEVADHPVGKAWVQQVEDDFYFDLHRFGFYPHQHLGYHHVGMFGMQCMYVDAGIIQPIRFKTMHLPEIYIRENASGEVDTVSREFSLSARQAAQFFGEKNLPEGIRKHLDAKKNQSQKFNFIHLVMPAEDRKRFVVGQNALPFASFYMSKQEEQLIAEGGYRQMPYIVTRAYKLPGTPYSYSPGTEALADVKMMNEMKALILEAGQLAVAPPYLVPNDGFVGRFSYEPRAMNYYKTDREGASANEFQPLTIGGDPRFSWELLLSMKQDINEAFFVDLFQAITARTKAKGDATAYEIQELASEKMFLLGPMLVNQQRENFQRLFDRMFSIKEEQGMLPPVPHELAGKKLKVEYTSPLVLAQKEAQTQSMLKTYLEVGNLANIAPEVLDLFDHDENVRRILAQRGFPQTGIRPRGQVEELRSARAQAEQQAAAKQEMLEAAKVYPALAKRAEQGSPMSGDEVVQ